MAFLNQSMLQGRSEETVVETHPLLGQEDIPLHVRKMYVYGCVFAVLMDDSKIDDDELREIRKLGASLQLDGPTIDECIDTVRDMPESDRGGFVNDMLETVSYGKIGLSFLFDFERLLALHDGKVDLENYQILNKFGLQITGREHWREAVDELELPTGLRDVWDNLCHAAERTGDETTASALQHISDKKWDKRKEKVRAFANTWRNNAQDNCAQLWQWAVAFGSRKWHGYSYALIAVGGVVAALLLWLVLYLLVALLKWLGWTCIPGAIMVGCFSAAVYSAEHGKGAAEFLWNVFGGVWSLIFLICVLCHIFG